MQLQRAKYLKEMKLNKNRENETLAKLNEFTSKIRAKEVKNDASNWMNSKLKFHVDSQKAFDVSKASQFMSKSGTGAHFEDFLTGGDPAKKYAGAYA